MLKTKQTIVVVLSISTSLKKWLRKRKITKEPVSKKKRFLQRLQPTLFYNPCEARHFGFGPFSISLLLWMHCIEGLDIISRYVPKMHVRLFRRVTFQQSEILDIKN